ncbi:MAG: ribosome biogenesis factor YjgA [Halioglobus sp.]
MADAEDRQGLDDAFAPPSKSARKRRMHALQRLGESLLELSEAQLDKLSLNEPALLEALQEARRIRSHSARKRHLQYIGKLMREIDPEPIESALAALHASRHADTQAFHALEALRDRLLASPQEGVELTLQRFPTADRQQLRQLLRQHASEQREGRPPAASRKLFRYLRELAEL